MCPKAVSDLGVGRSIRWIIGGINRDKEQDDGQQGDPHDQRGWATLRVEWEYDMRKRRSEEQKAAMGSRRSEEEQFRRNGVRSSCYAS
ncbi:hypothetical protein PoB_003805000 [Plakobranchus ocellatus]|uniref:Uncharacterized protein n=1 Tax=Plakobranchus ocellatus TaxID=259542 RepID=A0AAV4AT81_9GAST|nr:hypothetical protein PoB_003805000 [Plakobranchus ocellatus]